MKKNILLICIALLSMQIQTSTAHSGKPKYHIIIDSDGAIDDMRAITMFLACNDVRVLGITGSQGSIKSYSAAIKITSLGWSANAERLSTSAPSGLASGSSQKINANSSPPILPTTSCPRQQRCIKTAVCLKILSPAECP